MTPRDTALQYLERGWVPIPLCWPTSEGKCGCGRGHTERDIGKAPLLGKGYQGVRPDEAQVGAWWDRWPHANVGILLEPSRLVLVDLDSDDAAREIQERLPATAYVTTGKGWHVYYQAPGGLPGRRRTKWGDCKEIDLLGKGYVVAPPSIHATGRAYAWEGDLGCVADAPGWLVAALSPPTPPKPRTLSFAPPELSELRGALYSLTPDCSREEWIRLGMAVWDGTAGSAAGLDLWDAWSSQGSSYKAGECARVWRGFGPGPVRVATLFGKAREGGWRPEREERPQARRPPRRPEPPPIHEDPTQPPPGGGGGGEDTESDGGYRSPLEFDSHVYLALVVAEGLAQGAPLVGTDAGLYRYQRGVWDAIGEDVIIGAVHDLDQRFVYLGDDKDGKPRYKRFKANDGTIQGVCRQIVYLRHLRQNGFFDDPAPGLGFQNGFLEVTKDGAALAAHSPDHRCRFGAEWDWDPAQPCPRWEMALREWFEPDLSQEKPYDQALDALDRVRFLQEFVGAAILGIAPRYERCALFYGRVAGNGKSKCFGAIEELFPKEERAAISPHQVAGQRAPYYLAALEGVRLNIAPDLPGSEVVSGGAFKAMVSGDPQAARHPSGRVFRIKPKAAHIFASNHLPPTRDQTEGWWRRFVILGFERSFRDGDGVKDPDLPAKLKAESPGILRWGIEGAVRLLEQGAYTIPASHKHYEDQWKREACSVAYWLSVDTEPVDELKHGTKKQECWERYKEWAPEAGFGRRMVNSRTFYKRLANLVLCDRVRGPHYAKIRFKGRANVSF